MATIADFALDARVALSGIFLTPQVSGFREEQLVAVGATVSRFRVVEVEVATAGSNLSLTLARAETEIIVRSNSVLTTDRGNEESIATLCETVADPAFWTGLASVRSSPSPEIEIPDAVERIGNCYRVTVSAQVALEV